MDVKKQHKCFLDSLCLDASEPLQTQDQQLKTHVVCHCCCDSVIVFLGKRHMQ